MESNKQGEGNQQLQVKGWVLLLERHPASWFVLGLLLVLLSEGSIRVSVASLGVSLLPPTSGSILRPILALCGISLAIVVALLHVQGNFRRAKQKFGPSMGVAFFAVWMLAVGGIAWRALAEHSAKAFTDEWSFDSEAAEFSVTLGHEDLMRHNGDTLLLAVRMSDDLKEASADRDVVFSEAKPIQKPTRPVSIKASTKSIMHKIKIGDLVEGHVLIVPSGTDLSEIQSINDVLRKGGSLYFPLDSAPRASSSVDRATVEAISVAVRELGPLDKKRLIEVLQGAPSN